MISTKFESMEKYTIASSKNSVSFGADGRITFSENCISTLGLNGDDIRVEPKLWVEQKKIEKKGKVENRTTTKKIAFVFGPSTDANSDSAHLREIKNGNQKYISGKGYLQKNDFLRHLMNSPVRFQHDAISFETSGQRKKHNVIIVDLLKKGRNKVST